MLKSSENKKSWRSQIMNSPIIKIVLKLDQHLLLNSKNRGPCRNTRIRITSGDNGPLQS